MSDFDTEAIKEGTIGEDVLPQLVAKSESIQNLLGLRAAWDTVSGPIKDDTVNHAWVERSIVSQGCARDRTAEGDAGPGEGRRILSGG